jgi:hypothetical protein
VTGSDREIYYLRPVGDRFRSKLFVLGRCGQQVPVRKVVDVGYRFRLRVFYLERCGQQIRIRIGCCS